MSIATDSTERLRHARARFRRVSIAGVLVTAGFAGLSHAEAGVRDPYRIAAEHAGLAAEARSVAAIHQHLQHVLNCLEGRDGQDFNALAGDPCGGSSALATLPNSSADHVRASKAIALARVGITLHHMAPSHYVAAAVHAILIENQH
ncbi:MAG: hypothetical protein KGQ45_14165 [Burkholderiales bacterium]|nr:hypothetical protein [Burkholderiales bacterium]